MKDNLVECPFCGGEVSIALCDNDEEQWYFITRGNGESKCDCRLFMESEKFYKDSDEATKVKIKSDLINRWNGRFCRCRQKENYD